MIIFHYADPQDLTIETLSDKSHMTPRHLDRLLKEQYGMSFTEKLQAEKMRSGKYLLENTDHSIGKIREICGVTPTYFIRCFKKRYAITPAQYRKSYKGAEPFAFCKAFDSAPSGEPLPEYVEHL